MAATGSVSAGQAPAASATTSTNGSGSSTSVATPLPAMTEAHWQALSAESVAILRQVLVPIHLEGFKTTEVATRLGIPLASVRLLVAYFADEVSELAQPDS